MPTLYYDPGLWETLRGLVDEEATHTREKICAGHWKTLEEARLLLGYLRALEWVTETAHSLQAQPTEDVE